MGSSYSESTQQDNRTVIESDSLLAMTAPESKLTTAPFTVVADATRRGRVETNFIMPDPFSLVVGDKGRAEVAYGNIDYRVNDMDGINRLVSSIFSENQKTFAAIGDLGQNVLSSVSTAAGEIKEPLLKYAPVAIVGGIVFLYYLLKGK